MEVQVLSSAPFNRRFPPANQLITTCAISECARDAAHKNSLSISASSVSSEVELSLTAEDTEDAECLQCFDIMKGSLQGEFYEH